VTKKRALDSCARAAIFLASFKCWQKMILTAALGHFWVAAIRNDMASESSVMPMSDQLHRPVVVAMIAMRVMEPSVHQVINMITVRDGFVSAVRTMLMA
jgi:hypothetical protein